MLINNGDGTFIGGPLDKLVILRNVQTGRFHVCFFEEAPFPGPRQEVSDAEIVRLKSKMHHTEGGASLEEAHKHFGEMRNKILMDDENYDLDPIPWDGQIPIVTVVPNWRRDG